jgi:hypothetical protein
MANLGNQKTRRRNDLVDALTKYLDGYIAKHQVNINHLLDNSIALAEHPDIIDTLDKELDILASYEDKLGALNKYFVGDKTTTKELIKG